VPTPKIHHASTETPSSSCSRFSINQLEVRRGEFLWNNRRIPCDFNASGVSADMSYSFLHGRYEGNLLLGRVETQWQDYRPFVWLRATHFSLGKNEVEVTFAEVEFRPSHIEAHGRVTTSASRS